MAALTALIALLGWSMHTSGKADAAPAFDQGTAAADAHRAGPQAPGGAPVRASLLEPGPGDAHAPDAATYLRRAEWQRRSIAARATDHALTRLGLRYVWGGTSPVNGFDCSGLVQWAYAQEGVTLPRTTWQMAAFGTPVRRGQLQRGDLVFAYDREHMGIYLGRGQYVHASSSRGVRVSEVPTPGAGYAGAVRVMMPAD